MDRNKDGILNRDEIRRGLAEMGVRLTATELDSVMRAFDKDQSGRIDYLEFYTVLTKHRVEAAAAAAELASAPMVGRLSPTSASGSPHWDVDPVVRR